ncbi:acetyl/propionyl/methylcrotonyl-CoA carboxylase subunit alpha [Saccharicrinis sp. FJH62]|uniref:acetyl/propionyl/methylcrotonyl-CoA carboxylase subunit alpha n=1 Tax=Saccharicrinis sp. FJH62 TaxID=3344657 RepID=UPI0035D4F266
MKTFNRILVANRGEIVARIMKTAHQMGTEVVVLYTDDDTGHIYLKEADVAVLLDGKSLSETFLNKERIIDIALANGVDAIHPGYGFLSENAEFAQMCKAVGITWIGPSPNVIRLMGYKKSAREFAEKLGIPVLHARYGSADELVKYKDVLQYPVMIKAQAGGGGKGMRVVRSSDNFEDALHITGKEAGMFFGDESLYVEEFIEDARHIEVQVFGDNFGNVIHMHERECTVQRRHQKIIEEAPAFGISDALRKSLHQNAVKLAKAAKYRNAGTVEFIVDRQENFYFLEMNTRIQVEHPVTEFVTNVDVVREQLLIAAGNEFAFTQDEIICRGHALECRLYAEDPEKGFMPQNGTLTLNAAPELKSVRVDGSFERTAVMSSAYDPLIAKVITGGQSRLEAMRNMIGALEDYKIQGVKTNKGFLTNLLKSPVLIQNNIHTQYCDLFTDRHIDMPMKPDERFGVSWFFLNAGIQAGNGSVWSKLGNWRHQQKNNITVGDHLYAVSGYKANEKEWQITVNDKIYQCSLVKLNGYELHFIFNNEPVKVIWSKKTERSYFIEIDHAVFLVQPHIVRRELSPANEQIKARNVLSPLPGRVMRVYVTPGEKVVKGKAMLVIESMKIENRIVADHDSVVKSVLVSEGQQLNGNDLVIELE